MTARLPDRTDALLLDVLAGHDGGDADSQARAHTSYAAGLAEAGARLDGVRLEKAVPHRLAEGARIQAAQVLFTFASSSGVWRRLEAEALRH